MSSLHSEYYCDLCYHVIDCSYDACNLNNIHPTIQNVTPSRLATAIIGKDDSRLATEREIRCSLAERRLRGGDQPIYIETDAFNVIENWRLTRRTRVGAGARSLPRSRNGAPSVEGRAAICVRATERRQDYARVRVRTPSPPAQSVVVVVVGRRSRLGRRGIDSCRRRAHIAPTATRNVRARMHDESPSARHRCQIEISLPLRTCTKNDIVRLSLGSSSSSSSPPPRFTLDGAIYSFFIRNERSIPRLHTLTIIIVQMLKFLEYIILYALLGLSSKLSDEKLLQNSNLTRSF
ncbi:hypothetical protein QTP88_005588 [Uroleucon formosanum]